MVVGHEYPRGWGGGEGGAMLPRKFFEINSRQEPITPDSRWDGIWCILRHNFEKLFKKL